MICDKHCPMLDKNGDCLNNDLECELRNKGSICGDCIHDAVCGEEGHLDPAMIFCVEKVSRDAVGMIGRIKGLRLSDLIPYLIGTPWFTVIRRTGETCNKCASTYPEKFLVNRIAYDDQEQKIVIILDEDNEVD